MAAESGGGAGKTLSTFLFGVAAAAGLFLLGGVQLGDLNLKNFKIPFGSGQVASEAKPHDPQRGIRVGTFNIQVFGEKKLEDAEAMRVIVAVARQFDVLAIQEVRAKSQDVLPRFLEMINATGAKYDYAISTRLGRTSSKEQYAYLFDTNTIEMDRTMSYVVGDPDDLLHREPFVGAFRVKGVPPEQAFTFTLVDIHTDPDEVESEMNALDDVYRAVRRDSRQEDDVIILGDLNADDRHFGELGLISDLDCVVRNTPTNTRGTQQYDNIIFSRTATTEYLGRGGVMDLVSEFHLTLDQALVISDHLPVWAEFSPYEGGAHAPHLADRPVVPLR